MVTRSQKGMHGAQAPIEKVSLNVLTVNLTQPCKVVLKHDPLIVRLTGSKDSPPILNEKEQAGNEQKQLVHQENFAEGDIIWARMRGFPYWPAKVRFFFQNL